VPRTTLKTDRPDDAASLEAATNAGALGPLHAYVGYALRRAQLAIFQDFIRTLAEVDLRPAQFSVLTLIDAHPGILQSRAAAALGIQKANFVPLIGELERRELTRRVPVDGRSNGMHVTPKGRALLKRARALHDRHHARVTASIGDADLRRLIDVLERLAAVDTDDRA
jgi:DNA-binding MarR family transcriptional regulator